MLRTDLVIFKSERMTQNDDGGGHRTAAQVENGKLNDVFGNISEIDHAQSAVDIVKIYPSVNTNTTQLLQDAHVLVNEPPNDPLVDVLLLEAAGINDASLRSDIVEQIESGVLAGLLLRTGMSEMLAGQDTLNPLDLQSAAALPGEQLIITLNVGQIIAIAVEYLGNENPLWPRFTHYAKVISKSQFAIQFEPAIPYPAPGKAVIINGENRCTVLRATAKGQGVTYHGTTKLTASASGTTLNVESTTGQIIPRITQLDSRIGNKPFAADGNMVFTVVTVPASGVSYAIEIANYANLPGRGNLFIDYISGGLVRQQVQSNASFVGDQFQFVLNYLPDAGSELTIRYFSDRYQHYINSDAIPVGWSLLMSTVSGDVLAASGTRYSAYADSGDPARFSVLTDLFGLQLAAILNPEDGTATYYNGYTDFDYSAVVEDDSAASESATECTFVLPFSEVMPSSFYLSVELTAGGLLSASSDVAGDISGFGISGTLSGIYVTLTFTNPVKLSSLTYNVDEVVILVPPASLYGINPLRLANGGVVNIFRPFGVVCVSNNDYQTEVTLTSGQIINLRPNSFIDIVDSMGVSLWSPLDLHFSYEKSTGVVTIADVTGFVGPYEVIDSLSELRLVTAVTANTLRINTPLAGSYPPESVVSSVAILGDLQASVSTIFDQSIWSGVWQDVINGSPALANYNQLNFPITVANQSAINERWVILFTSVTAYRCIGEKLGEIAAGDTLNDFSPVNPATGLPYFFIPQEGWGAGWVPGVCLRFNTIAASRPLAAVRSVSAGHSLVEQDSIRLFFRGNAE